MERTKYIAVTEPEVERLLDAIDSAPKEKQPMIAVLAEAFINGMNTQAKLTDQTGQSSA